MNKIEDKKFVISVLVADRAGIMRDIASAIADMGANIDNISQTVVEGYFSVILTASFPEKNDCERITTAIATNFSKNEASIIVRSCSEMPAPRKPHNGEKYVLVVAGRDRPGIIKLVSCFLADRNINIEDWTCHFDDKDVTYIGEITVPKALSIGQVQLELNSVLMLIGVSASLQHENIFRATNEIGSIKSLLS